MTTPIDLSPAVLAEVARLGGQFTPKSRGASDISDIDGHPVPMAVAQFLFDTRWPNQTYFSEEDSVLWVWGVRFNIVGWLEPEEFVIQGRGERPLIYFAQADGGNYFLLLDLDDPHPDNPQVYQIDHYDPEQTLSSSARLSEFLQALQPETES
jgi:hypothetical protein